MKLVVQSAIVCCDHQSGIVAIAASQSLVTVNGVAVLVEGDPVGKGIAGCPNLGATIKPCTTTTSVTDGYSSLLRIDGRKVCLDTVTGLTDGTPPGTVKHSVRSPGQILVGSDG
jgi:hypothetical protein